MNFRRNALLLMAKTTMLLAAAFSISAQSNSPGEPSYQVSLQFVVGTNDGGKSELPSTLSTIARDLKSNFGFSNYRVAGTLLGRVGSNGNYEYRSVSNILGQETGAAVPTFLEWTVAGLHTATVEKGPSLQGNAFRFGARVPVTTGRDEAGRPAVNYENIGITAMKFGLAENTPTLMGTLSLPNTPGMIFLVVTARTTE